MSRMDQQEWFTAREAAEFLRVGRTTIYRMSKAGQLRYHVLPGGKGQRFHRNDLDDALRGQEHTKEAAR